MKLFSFSSESAEPNAQKWGHVKTDARDIGLHLASVPTRHHTVLKSKCNAIAVYVQLATVASFLLCHGLSQVANAAPASIYGGPNTVPFRPYRPSMTVAPIQMPTRSLARPPVANGVNKLL